MYVHLLRAATGDCDPYTTDVGVVGVAYRTVLIGVTTPFTSDTYVAEILCDTSIPDHRRRQGLPCDWAVCLCCSSHDYSLDFGDRSMSLLTFL